jgi:acyl-coenzyme A thioesterase PaaI-like protein
VLHGVAIRALADTAGALCASLELRRDDGRRAAKTTQTQAVLL